MSSFSVSSSRMSLFHLLSWRTFFSEDRILDLQFFYFSSFKMFLFLVTSKLSKEKSTIHSNIFPLCNAPFFFGSVPDFFVISLKKKKVGTAILSACIPVLAPEQTCRKGWCPGGLTDWMNEPGFLWVGTTLIYLCFFWVTEEPGMLQSMESQAT